MKTVMNKLITIKSISVLALVLLAILLRAPPKNPTPAAPIYPMTQWQTSLPASFTQQSLFIPSKLTSLQSRRL